ncbi:MAG: GNAT family N-acetyltransferase [Gemmatimonadetes bacterium]|nr:GNAT family N-acetyltransferase [Gemmatimonadota bacterium]
MSRSTAPAQPVTTWYLEMTSPAELRARRIERTDVTLTRIEEPWPELNRFFYAAVGEQWSWKDRLEWSREDWMRWLDRPDVETWVLAVAGLPAGYFELERQGDSVELAYFGLIDRFTGQGLGAHLLTEAVERAWAPGPKRVWVHTCTLDHPSALDNYRARGFRVYREETTTGSS